MTEQFSVILNLFQDPITQKLEGRQLKPMNVKKSGGQASLEGKKLRRYEGRLFTLKSLSSNPHTFLSSNNYPSPQPSPIGEGAICHSEGGQASLEGKKIRRYEGRLFTLKSLSSNLPTLLSSNNQLFPLSRKGRGRSTSRFTLHPSLKRNAAFTLAEGATHVDTTDNVRRAAFTLAEVLITLGIIGVVAAMTMPALITNHQKKQTVVQLKKAYTVLSQALQRSILDNGEVESWDWQSIPNADADLFAQKYILPYLKGADNISSRALGSRKYWKSLDGTYDSSGSYMDGYPMYALPDGMLLSFTGRNTIDDPVNRYGTKLRINIDINGDRGPNQYGRDVFVFTIFPFDSRSNGKLVPGVNERCSNGAIHNNLSRDFLVYNGCWTCKHDHTGTGYGCAAVIMKDGWEIKDDYPW